MGIGIEIMTYIADHYRPPTRHAFERMDADISLRGWDAGSHLRGSRLLRFRQRICQCS